MIQQLGKYAIVKKLSQGSMGAVYKAKDSVLDRHVAIKIMAEDIQWDPELKVRFYREARAAANIHHPNIVTIHDLGEEGKITYIVMELLEGTDLKEIIDTKVSLPLEDKISIIAQVAEGLNHAHLHGIIHRDIKPGNIHVGPTGNAKILDFGIAYVPESDLTLRGVRLGTPVYMSPEQIRGEKYDARSDIFSVGIVFYELITQIHPFRDKTMAKTMDNICRQTQLPFEEQFSEAPANLWPILSTCLSKEPQKRHQSMADLAQACRDLLGELTRARQRMLRDLEGAMPVLEQHAKLPAASPQLLKLFKDVQKLLGQKEKSDYLSLVRLCKTLDREKDFLRLAPQQVQPRHKEPIPLPKENDRAARAGEKEQKGRDPTSTGVRDTSAAPATDPATRTRDWDRDKVHRILVWSGMAVLLLGVTFGALYLRQRLKGESKPPLDVTAQISLARSNLVQRRYDQAIEIARAVLAASPDDGQAQAILSEAQNQKRQVSIDILMIEAQDLRSQGRLEAANAALHKVLDLDPANPPALAVRSQVEAEISTSKSKEEQDSQIRMWLANVDSFLAAGKLSQAKSEIDKIQRLRPDAPELPAVHRRLNARTTAAARNQPKERQTPKQQIDDLSRRAEELFGQGRYSDAQRLIEQWLVVEPQGREAQSLQARTREALAAMKAFEDHLAARDYEGALGAVSRLERGNPSDPNIAELRKRAGQRKSAAGATVSIYPLGEPGVLFLDGQQLGSGGEVEKKAVSAGRHKIEVKGKTGTQGSREVVFLDGQDLTIVYDSTGSELRPITAADQQTINRRRQRAETHRFPVEHLHGFLRGKCKGDLLISGVWVNYKPEEGDHEFSLLFRNLKLAVKEEKLDITEPQVGNEYQFKAQDAKQAGSFKNLWEDLQKIGK